MCVNGYVNNLGNCQSRVTTSPPNCQSYNVGSLYCNVCNSGFSLNAGRCEPYTSQPSGQQNSQTVAIASQITSSTASPKKDINCALLDSSGKCLRCSNRAYFGSDGRCALVSPLCKTHSKTTGACLSCY